MGALGKWMEKFGNKAKDVLHGTPHSVQFGDAPETAWREGGILGQGGLKEKAMSGLGDAGEWAQENPYKTVGGAVGLGAGGALAAHELGDDDDSLDALLGRAKKKVHGYADQAESGIGDLLKKLGLG